MFGREKYHYSGEYLTLLYFLCRARPWCRCVRSRRDWGHCPGSEGSQTNPARCGHKGSLFTVLGRSSSVWRMPWGGLPGAGQGHRDALPQHRAAASAGHRTERKKNNQFFRGESPRKCAKRDTGTVWKSRAMFH